MALVWVHFVSSVSSSTVAHALIPEVVSPLASPHPTLQFLRSRPLEGGSWLAERVEQSFIIQAVKPGNSVLEIGANIGRSSVIAAAAAGPTGRVVSSEADPERRRVAARNAQNLTGIEFISAISDTPLTLTRGDLGASTSDGYHAEHSSKGYTVATTPVRTIAEGLRPNVVIADCEGCFDQLYIDLQNASHGRFFEHVHTIVLEHDSSNFATQWETHAELGELGFHPTCCVEGPGDVHTKSDDPAEVLRQQCFWSVLQRTSAARRAVMVLRNNSEDLGAFQARAEQLTLGTGCV